MKVGAGPNKKRIARQMAQLTLVKPLFCQKSTPIRTLDILPTCVWGWCCSCSNKIKCTYSRGGGGTEGFQVGFFFSFHCYKSFISKVVTFFSISIKTCRTVYHQTTMSLITLLIIIKIFFFKSRICLKIYHFFSQAILK